MKRIRIRRRELRGWIIPLAYSLGAVVTAMIIQRAEHYFLPNLTATVSAQAMVAICSSVASGMIALTGIVFSLTFLMIQFSASAYSPRLVVWVARAPVMAHALGVFNATFLYALTLLAWVDRNGSGKVPFLTGWLLFLLLLASMGMFIALIERVGLLQVTRMLVFTGQHGRKAIEDLYRPRTGSATEVEEITLRNLPVLQTLHYVGRPQVIQSIYTAGLVRLATQTNTVIELVSAVGDTVLEQTPLLRVRGTGQPLPEAALRDAIQLGDERTFEQDPKYALRLVVDIAIKALSPAINDPTTAVQALDQIEDLLLRLGRQQLEIGTFRDEQARVRLVIPFPSWEDLLRLALDETCHYGADSVQVMRRMKALIRQLKTVLPPERHAALQHWDDRLQASIARTFVNLEEQRAASTADRQGLGTGQESNPGSPR